MRIRTRRVRTVESLVVEAVFTAVHDICVRTLSGAILIAQIALATAYVAATVLRCLAAAAWESVNADDRRALRQGSAIAVRGCWWAARRLPGWVVLAAVATYRRCEAVGTHAADRVYEAMRREVARSQGWARQTPQEERDEYDDLWQDEGSPVGRVAA